MYGEKAGERRRVLIFLQLRDQRNQFAPVLFDKTYLTCDLTGPVPRQNQSLHKLRSPSSNDICGTHPGGVG